MSSDDYKVNNIHSYTRKLYNKKHRRESHDGNISPREFSNIETPNVSPRVFRRNDEPTMVAAGCNCDLNPEAEIAKILHKKCPVITLAQQQLQKLIEESDNFINNNAACCRTICDFLRLCKVYLSQDKCRCVLVFFIVLSFLMGVLLGAASCGSYLGRFDSIILSCIDNYFITNAYSSIEDSYRGIV